MYSIEETDIATFPSSLELILLKFPSFPNRLILVNASLFRSKTGITECFQTKIDILVGNYLLKVNRNTRTSVKYVQR